VTLPPGLAPYVPQSDQEAATWAQLVALAGHGAAAFCRDVSLGGHITASAFVVSPDGQDALLTHHRKLDMWLQLGGHCDGIMDTRFVALKEAYEESGLARIEPLGADIFDVDILPVPAFGADPAHLHYDVRYLMQAADRAFTVSEESHDLAWVPLRNLEDVTREPTMMRMRDKALARRAG